jgi:hypothetical protein
MEYVLEENYTVHIRCSQVNQKVILMPTFTSLVSIFSEYKYQNLIHERYLARDSSVERSFILHSER